MFTLVGTLLLKYVEVFSFLYFSLFRPVKVKSVFHIKLEETVSPSSVHDQLEQTDH